MIRGSVAPTGRASPTLLTIDLLRQRPVHPDAGWHRPRSARGQTASKRWDSELLRVTMTSRPPGHARRKVMAQPQPFEIPQQLRELAEKNVETARAAYGQFMDAVAQAMGVWTSATPANAVTSSFQVVQDRAVKFAKQNAEACFNLASELANAKDVTDVIGIQSRHAQTQMQNYTLQTQELNLLMMKTTQSIRPKS